MKNNIFINRVRKSYVRHRTLKQMLLATLLMVITMMLLSYMGWQKQVDAAQFSRFVARIANNADFVAVVDDKPCLVRLVVVRR